MKKNRHLIVILILIMSSGISTAQETDSANVATSEFMYVEEIKPGMTGYGISAFKDNNLERFDVEILGVMSNAFPDMDIILARLSGPQFKEMGVVAGMSGSPVYIDNRMIGAVAYGWTFSMEPIAGITPIKNMLEVMDKTDDKPHPPEYAPPDNFLPETGGGDKKNARGLRNKQSLAVQTGSIPILKDKTTTYPDAITLEPLGTPLIISGCHPDILKRAESFFSGTSFMPVLGGGSRVLNPEFPIKPVENGSGIAIPMVSGSLAMAAVGTVTYRKGNKLVAFGHPFFEMGNLDAPMASAHIFTVVPSYMRPFKLGAAVQEIGCIRQDRQAAIGGFFGMEAPSFDVNVKIRMESSNTENALQYHIWENESVSGSLLDIVISESIIRFDKLWGVSAAKMRYKILLDDDTVIEKEEFLSTDRLLAYDVSLTVAIELMRLMTNPFKKVDIRNIQLDATIIDQFKAVAIETAKLDRDIYKPGETANIQLYFDTYRIPRFSRTLQFRLPEDLRDGAYTLHVLNGVERKRLEFRRSPGIANILSFDALIKNLKMNFPMNKLYVVLTEKETGIRWKEEEMPHLPPSIQSPTQASSVPIFSYPINMNFIREETFDTDFEIRGSRVFSLKVNKRGRQ
ncbi:hypothetical protein JW926_19210 [Candidatus Sumerlaeota bacterium]|nr:hypothetical protein [Candidatus Sumerlaeota bacterium]